MQSTLRQHPRKHLWSCCIPVSRELLGAAKFDFRGWLNAHAHHLLLESVHEKFGHRFFIAYLEREEREEATWHAKAHNAVYFRQTWVVTLH